MCSSKNTLLGNITSNGGDVSVHANSNNASNIRASKYTKKAISVSPNYISQKTNIATVDKTTGKITAVKKGRTKIIASYGSGKGAAKYVIRVKVN